MLQHISKNNISSVQSLSCVWLFATPWITASQASLSFTNPQSLFKLMSIMSVMPPSHLILCRPLLLLPPIPPSIKVFSNESTLHMRWPKYCCFSFSISPSNEHPGLISFRTDHTYPFNHHTFKPQYLYTFFSLFMPLNLYLSLVYILSIFGEGNGNPFQYSCLENPMDWEAW